MSRKKFNVNDMPIIDVDLSKTEPYRTSDYLNSPEAIREYLAQRSKAMAEAEDSEVRDAPQSPTPSSH